MRVEPPHLRGAGAVDGVAGGRGGGGLHGDPGGEGRGHGDAHLGGLNFQTRGEEAR